MRMIDVILSLTILIFLMPLFIIVVVILRFTGEGKVLYVQSRIGRYGRPFHIYKFATMLKDSPRIGSGSITAKNDPRILPVGKYLRASKVNELPQIINILKGDMALIGPRPHVERDLLGVSVETQALIQTVRPGLSGVASIIFRDEEKILQLFDDPRDIYDNYIAPCKARLEVWYVSNKNFLLDLVLIFCTIQVVLFKSSNLLFIFYPELRYALDLISEMYIRADGAR